MRSGMLSLVEAVSTAVRNDTGGSGLVYINIGGALEDLDGGLALKDYINGYVREEVFFYSDGACKDHRAPFWEWWRLEYYLRLGVEAGLVGSVVEFVSNPTDVAYALMAHSPWGNGVILQPACDPYYYDPQLHLSATR